MEGAGVGEVEVRRVGCAVNEGLISRLQHVKKPNNYEGVCSFWWLGLVSSIICVSYAVSFANALNLVLSIYSASENVHGIRSPKTPHVRCYAGVNVSGKVILDHRTRRCRRKGSAKG